jgi:hypothetical protein
MEADITHSRIKAMDSRELKRRVHQHMIWLDDRNPDPGTHADSP